MRDITPCVLEQHVHHFELLLGTDLRTLIVNVTNRYVIKV